MHLNPSHTYFHIHLGIKRRPTLLRMFLRKVRKALAVADIAEAIAHAGSDPAAIVKAAAASLQGRQRGQTGDQPV
jgi:hypothetical protein